MHFQINAHDLVRLVHDREQVFLLEHVAQLRVGGHEQAGFECLACLGRVGGERRASHEPASFVADDDAVLDDVHDLAEIIDRAVIGLGEVVEGPFNQRAIFVGLFNQDAATHVLAVQAERSCCGEVVLDGLGLRPPGATRIDLQSAWLERKEWVVDVQRVAEGRRPAGHFRLRRLERDHQPRDERRHENQP